MNRLTVWERFEPARVRAVWTAVVALAVALGFAIPSDADALVTALIGVLAVVIPLVQGELTRRAVTPNAVVLARTDDPALLTPEDAATRDALGQLDERNDQP